MHLKVCFSFILIAGLVFVLSSPRAFAQTHHVSLNSPTTPTTAITPGTSSNAATPLKFGTTYPIYGGWNNYDTYSPEWTAGSDNVVWDFGNEEPVYRQLHSLKLKYNPKGEFHMTTKAPLDMSDYKWVSFTGRAESSDLNFGLTFTDSNNNPIGNTLKFSDHGGTPEESYWTQYNFPIEAFNIASGSAGGFRITQLSNDWGAEIYLDEMYLSTARGEDINPALPTPIPPGGPTPPPEKIRKYPPDTNPFVYIVPAIFAVIIVLFH